MKRPTSMCLLLCLGLSCIAAAQQPMATSNTITVSASGQVEVQPDTAVVSFVISSQNSDLRSAYAAAQAEAAQVRTLLTSQGIAPADANWSSYAVQPNVDYKTRRVTDYSVSVTLDVTLTDFSRIGGLLDAFSGAGVNALRSVNFELKNADNARAAAIADAYRQADQEAHALATAARRQLAGLDNATVEVNQPGVIRPAAMAMYSMAAAPAPTAQFTPQTINVTAHVTAVYRLAQ